MIVFISYDIADPTRLRKMHQFLLDFGINTQKSVFECDISKKQIEDIKKYINLNLDPKADAVRIYNLCRRCVDGVSVLGIGIRVSELDYDIV